MIVDRFKLYEGAVILLSSLFVLGVFFDVFLMFDISLGLIFFVFLYLYLTESERKSKAFMGFLWAFFIGQIYAVVMELIHLIDSYFGNAPSVRHAPYVGNMPFVIAYISLIVHMVRDFNFSQLIKRFKYHLLVLVVFNVYAIITLNRMVLEAEFFNVHTLAFLFESIYNSCILLVLSFSLLNYIYHETKASSLLLLGSMCIVFSEMVQVTYFFIPANIETIELPYDLITIGRILHITYSLLLILGFYFIYRYMLVCIKLKLKLDL